MLGERIRALRQKKGYTQEEIASRLHVTRQTISKWEKNYSVPDADLQVKLAEVLGAAMIFSVLGAAAYTNLSIDSMIEAPFTAEE